MTCSDFHDRFSDYYDGTGDPSFLGEADVHLAACADCRRYHAILVQGSAILRSSPRVTVSEDFLGRLQHRIYHIDDATAISQARRTAAELADRVGFNATQTSDLAIVVSEIASNIYKHAGEGCVVIQATEPADGAGIDVLGRQNL